MTTEFHQEPARAPVLAAPVLSRVRLRTAAGTWFLVVAGDLTAVVCASAGHALWRGGSVEAFSTATIVVAVVGLCLLLAGAWDRVTVELAALLRGFVFATAAVALASLAIESLAGRTWVFGALPAACALAVTGRLGLRPLLRRQRTTAITRVLAVGSDEAVASLVASVRRAPQHGWHVVAACTPSGTGPSGDPTIGDVLVVGDFDSVPRLARSGRFDTISVAPTGGWSRVRLRQLVSCLDGSRIELVVDPGLAGCTGSRTRMSNVEGLYLLRLSRPALPVSARLFKTVLDRTAALLLLMLTAPLLLALAVMVRLDGGPVFLRDVRVGGRGRFVGLLRFRTIRPDGLGTTWIGTITQQHGLDGLPQLLNLLAGSLALVGPRAPAVEDVIGQVRQHPLVTPGLTGLDGAGEIDDGELERRYVERWSPALDLTLLARALRSACRRVPR